MASIAVTDLGRAGRAALEIFEQAFASVALPAPDLSPIRP